MFLKKEDTYAPVLCVIDDGHGMTYDDMMRMISFGNKGPNKQCPDKIGRCGVGFKVHHFLQTLRSFNSNSKCNLFH